MQSLADEVIRCVAGPLAKGLIRFGNATVSAQREVPAGRTSKWSGSDKTAQRRNDSFGLLESERDVPPLVLVVAKPVGEHHRPGAGAGHMNGVANGS